MEKEQLDHSRETGKQVWESLRLQMAEGGGFLNAAWHSFRHFVRRHILYFLLFGILGGAVGAGIWYLKPEVYTAEMTVAYVHYEKKIYADMLKKLNTLAMAGSYGSLSRLLEMPEESVEKILSIHGYNIRKEDLAEDLSTERIPFYIKVEVTDLAILPDLESALVDYFNSTDYVRDRLEFTRKQSEAELEFLQRRLQLVDSLSRTLDARSDLLSEEKTVTRMELLEETLAVYDRIKSVKTSLAFNHNVEILDGFIPAEKPSGKGMKHYILLGFIAGLALWFVIIIFR